MQLEIGVVGVIVGILISYFTFHRNRDRDVKKDATEDAIVRTKLDYIGSGVDSIQIDMKVNDKRFEKMNETVIRIDESTKQAHKRLDGLVKESVK